VSECKDPYHLQESISRQVYDECPTCKSKPEAQAYSNAEVLAMETLAKTREHEMPHIKLKDEAPTCNCGGGRYIADHSKECSVYRPTPEAPPRESTVDMLYAQIEKLQRECTQAKMRIADACSDYMKERTRSAGLFELVRRMADSVPNKQQCEMWDLQKDACEAIKKFNGAE
jgi:hypothetical protein